MCRALALLTVGLGAAAGLESSIQVLHAQGDTRTPVGNPAECLPAFSAPHIPFNTSWDRDAVHADPADGCRVLTNAGALKGNVAVFDLSPSCLTREAVERAKAAEAVAALFKTASGLPASRSLLNTATQTLPLPTMVVDGDWAVQNLPAETATPVRFRLNVTALRDGVPVTGHLEADRDAFYYYELRRDGPLRVAVSTTRGDPDLYGTYHAGLDGEGLSQVALPGEGADNAYTSVDPGDDLISIPQATAGTYLWAVSAWLGLGYADYSIQVASGDAALGLALGVPLRVSAPRNQSLFFRLDVPAGGPDKPRLRFHMTSYTGQPSLWVCTRPAAAPVDSHCYWSTRDAPVSVVEIGAGDARALSCSGGCTYHAITKSENSGTAFSLAVSRGNERVSLIDGTPQVGVSRTGGGGSGGEAEVNMYTLHTNDTSRSVEVTATPIRGRPVVRVRNPQSGRTFNLTEADGWRRTFNASDMCTDCNLEISVAAAPPLPFPGMSQEDCVYSLTASTSMGIITLEDGMPHVETVSANSSEHFKVYIVDPLTDLHVAVTPISGDPDLFVSHTHRRPNSTNFEFASTSDERDAVTVSHAHPQMQDCTKSIDVGEPCVFYVTVVAKADATFTLSAALTVADSGLFVSAPAALVGHFVFTNAAFGRPLPFDGDALPLKVPEAGNGNACQAITADLHGHVALIERGECYFVDKVRHAQARGAASVIVYNNEDGQPRRMGTPSTEAAANLTITAVMVSKADGALFARHLADGERVVVTLQQPGNRPQQLIAGVPQHGRVERHEIRYYAFQLGSQQHNVTFVVTPEYGDPDLYVSTTAYPPTQTSYQWESSNGGEDSIEIRESDSNFCANCTYIVGVYGFSECEYSIVASSGGAAVLLQLGMPFTEHLDTGEWDYFRIVLDDDSSGLRIVVTPLTGDPDFYVSNTVTRPGREPELHTWESSEFGLDSVVIERDDPGFRRGAYYVGVTAYINSTFSILASAVNATTDILVLGRPQSVHLAEGTWQQFRFFVANATSVTVTATPIVGDPDLYVTTDGSRPSLTSFAFESSGVGEEQLHIDTAALGACTNCTYRLGVFAFSDTNFTLRAAATYAGDSAGGDGSGAGGGSDGPVDAIVLTDGQPYESFVEQGVVQYFRFFVDHSGFDINVTVTALSGDPDLFASFSHTRPGPLASEFHSTLAGGDSVTVSRRSSSFCTDCSLYIAVFGVADSRYTIVCNHFNETYTVLVDGVPQHASVPGGGTKVFRYVLRANALSVRFSVTPTTGDPDLYVKAGRELPSPSDYTWGSLTPGADTVLVSSSDTSWVTPPCEYHVLVHAWTATNFTLMASSDIVNALLEDGVPLVLNVTANKYEYFRIKVEAPNTGVEVVVTPLVGDPDLFLARESVTSRPNMTVYERKSTTEDRDIVRIDPGDPLMRECVARGLPCSLFVSVYGDENATASFSIVASLHTINRGLRVHGPASVAGQMTNYPALFGPPLPFASKAPWHLLATPEPRDACGNVTRPADVAGKVALVDRGTCYFTDKAEALQAAGAAAMIVVNSAGDDSALFMASPSLEAAERVNISSVLVGSTNGTALRHAVEEGQAVNLTLSQPGDRPRTLVDGLPMYGHAVRWEMVYYKFSMNDKHHDVTFTLLPEVGSADLFVRRADDGLPPTQSVYDASSAMPGSAPDTITIRAEDPLACRDCTMLIGVLAWSAANFTILAATEAAVVTLQNGVPHTDYLHVGETEFFVVTVLDPTHKLRVLVTPIAGDPDLCISRTLHTPRWESDECTWSSGDYGSDSVTVSHTDPDFGTGPYYIGVSSMFGNTSFIITATTGRDECILLVDGQPQVMSLDVDDMQCFNLLAPADAATITVSVTPQMGDPDIYVAYDGSRASTDHHDLVANHEGEDELTWNASDACVACQYSITVHAFTATNFTVQATVSRGADDDSVHSHRVLLDAQPLTTRLAAGSTAYFLYHITQAGSEVDLLFSRVTGTAHLFASFLQPYPDGTDHTWESLATPFNAHAGIAIAAGDPRRCPANRTATGSGGSAGAGAGAGAGASACVLYLSVQAMTNSTVTLLGIQREDAVVRLVNGQPQQDVLLAGSYHYFDIAVPVNATSLSVSVTPFSGDPDLYIAPAQRAARVRPNATNYVWSQVKSGADSILIHASDSQWVRPPAQYVIGVFGWRATNYTIVASSSSQDLMRPVLLLNGQPQTDTITTPSGYRFYKFVVDFLDRDAALGVEVAVTPFSGDPDIYASFNDTRPMHTSSATLFASHDIGADSLHVSPFHPAFCPNGAPCTLYIGIQAYGGGNASYSIVATQTNDTAVALIDGVPQHQSLDAYEWQYYTFQVPDASPHLWFNVAPYVGDPDVYISTDEFPTEVSYTWSSLSSGADALAIARDDPAWCTDCTLRVGVRAFTASNYSITASTSLVATVLEDGVPHMEEAANGTWDYFRIKVESPRTDLEIIVTPLGGNPDVYVSDRYSRPNATHHDFASTTLGQDSVQVMHTDERMRACTGSSGCFFYVGVLAEAQGGTALFTVTATLSVVDRGLHIDTPENLRGGLTFSNAVFGMPLPFEGTSRLVVAASPRDACRALNNSAGALNDRVALVERGSCFFVDKVRHAQDQGAFAVIVVNNAEGPPVRMGAPSSEAAQGLQVPTVMISRDDGTRIFAALDAGTTVMATLQQPGDRPQLLVDGLPQHGTVDQSQMKFYKYRTGDEPSDVVFTVTPTVGDPDLYISMDGLPPTLTHFSLSSADSGADTVVVQADAAQACGVRCEYYIGVYGWSEADFTITAAAERGVSTLELGMPQSGHLAQGSRRFYRVFLEGAGTQVEDVRVTLTALTGDADLFASQTARQPTHATSTWASERIGDDTIVLSASDARLNTSLLPGFVYVTVAAASNTTYTLSAASVGRLRLVDRRPQRMSLGAEQWQYFALAAPREATSLTVTCTPSFGDPDLYLGLGQARPTLDRHGWLATTAGGDVLRVDGSPRSGGRLCNGTTSAPADGCSFTLGVYAWTSTNFSIVAVFGAADSARCMELEDGTAVYGAVGANESQCFTLGLESVDQNVAVSLTSLSGDAELAAGFVAGAPPRASASTAVSAGAYLSLEPECMSTSITRRCVVHINVTGITTCAFSLAASQHSDARTVELTDGRPQYESLQAGAWSYYSFVAVSPALRAAVPVTVALVPLFGDPNLYVRADDARPNATSFTWRSTAAGGDQLLISGADPHACRGTCRYVIGVHAASATNFSISVYTHNTVVTLQDGVPLTAVAAPSTCAEMAVHALPGATWLNVSVTALSGAPEVFVGADAHPSQTRHLPGASAATTNGHADLRVNLTAAEPRPGPSGGGGDNAARSRARPLYVSVCAGAGGEPSRFVIVARLRSADPPLLLDGRPFAGTVSHFSLVPFRVVAGPDAARMQITLTPLSGDVELLLSPRGRGHDASNATAAADAASWRSHVPGVNTIVARRGDADWCAPCEFMVGVHGLPEANFTLLVTLERGYTLRNGEPQTAQLLSHASSAADTPMPAAFFAYSVDEPVGFRFLVTVYSGSPRVFASTTHATPKSLAEATWAAGASCAAGGLCEVRVPATDPHFCAPCTYYLGVVAVGETANASVAVTAVSDTAPAVSLVNGLPLMQSLAGRDYAYFAFTVEEGAGDVTFTAQPQVGDKDVEMYVTADGRQPSADHYTWASDAHVDEEDQVTVLSSDTSYCSKCTYKVAVYAIHATNFSIVAATSTGTVLLPLGMPSVQRLSTGRTSFFKALLDPSSAESARVSVRPLRDPVHVALDTVAAQPSDAFSKAVFDAGVDEPVSYTLDAATRLRTWCSHAVQSSGVCPLYIAVSSPAADAALFAITVSQGAATVLVPGLPQAGVADAGRPALFSLGADDQADDMVISVTIGPAAQAQAVEVTAWVDTGDDASRGHTWTAAADETTGGVGSIFIAKDDSHACKSCSYKISVQAQGHCEFTVIAASDKGHTLLVPGTTVHAQVSEGQFAYYKAYNNRDDEALSVTVEPCYGNPDLYVSDTVSKPGPPSYMLASAQSDQVEKVTVAASALSSLQDVLYIAVHGQTETAFTVSLAAGDRGVDADFVHGDTGGLVTVSDLGKHGATVAWFAAQVTNRQEEEVLYAVEVTDPMDEADKQMVLFTACGLQQSARPAANRTQADADEDGKLTARLKDLQPGKYYEVNVRATRPHGELPLIYRPITFQTAGGAGGPGAGAVVAIVLACVLCCVLAAVGAAIAYRRKQLAERGLLRHDGAVDMQAFQEGGDRYSALVASPLNAAGTAGGVSGATGADQAGGGAVLAGLTPLFAPGPVVTRPAHQPTESDSVPDTPLDDYERESQPMFPHSDRVRNVPIAADDDDDDDDDDLVGGAGDPLRVSAEPPPAQPLLTTTMDSDEEEDDNVGGDAQGADAGTAATGIEGERGPLRSGARSDE